MLEISKILTISTAHLSQEDIKFLEYKQLYSFKSEYGYIISTFNWGYNTGFSETFLNLLVLATRNDCTYLQFDRDASILPDFPTFKW